MSWQRVCSVEDLEPERGSAALLGDEQVALFLLHDGTVVAVQHRDPVSGAHVMARGIVGSRFLDGRGEVPTVASPMHKQVFDLTTGECLDGAGADPDPLRTWPVRVEGGEVLLPAAQVPA